MMGFTALYPSCEDYCDRGLWLFGESGPGKVLIEGIRRADPKPPHHYKRDAIGERVVFVLMLNKVKPAIVEQVLINMDHLNGGAAEEDVPHFDGFGVVTAAVEARVGWVEHSETHQWTADGYDGFRLSPLPFLPQLQRQ